MKPNIGKGDKGETVVLNGKIDKASPLLGLIGKLDILNSFVGFSRSFCKNNKELDKILKDIQSDIFIMSSQLAGSRDKKLGKEAVEKLEKYITQFEKEIEPLNKFIYPTGTTLSASLHVVRSICRDVEREAFLVAKNYDVPQEILSYLNRLSDLLFVLARVVNKRSSIEDEKWNV